MAFTNARLVKLQNQMMDYARQQSETFGSTNQLEDYTIALNNMVWRSVKEHNETVGGWHVGESIGRAWISCEERRNDPDCRCQCVVEGQVELVVSDHPDDLAQEHRNGDWCPCEGQQKKWIYLHEPSQPATAAAETSANGTPIIEVNDPKYGILRYFLWPDGTKSLVTCFDEHEKEHDECVGCQEGLDQYHVAHFEEKSGIVTGRRLDCRIVDN